MRASWDQYFIGLALMAATRSTCPKASVGSVVVLDRKIVGHGYNGAPRGSAHCTEVGCIEINNHCFRVLHAEENAIVNAGTECEGATLYCSHLPCLHCCKLLINAGISQVVYSTMYYDDRCLALQIRDQSEFLFGAQIGVHRVTVSDLQTVGMYINTSQEGLSSGAQSEVYDY